jgi:methionine sulfoxide reductase heme-binding subunit
MSGTVSVGPHLFWITSRAAGTAALVLSSISLGLGLAVARQRRAGGGGTAPVADYRAVHEALALSTLAMIALHGLALLGDHWLNPGVTGIALPLVSSYRPAWTAIGIVAGYGLAALGLTYFARDRIGSARWRSMHRFTSLFWVLGVAHSIGSGTDAWRAWFLLVGAAAVLPGLVLLLGRIGRSLGTLLDLPRSEPPVRESAR